MKNPKTFQSSITRRVFPPIWERLSAQEEWNLYLATRVWKRCENHLRGNPTCGFVAQRHLKVRQGRRATVYLPTLNITRVQDIDFLSRTQLRLKALPWSVLGLLLRFHHLPGRRSRMVVMALHSCRLRVPQATVRTPKTLPPVHCKNHRQVWQLRTNTIQTKWTKMTLLIYKEMNLPGES